MKENSTHPKFPELDHHNQIFKPERISTKSAVDLYGMGKIQKFNTGLKMSIYLPKFTVSPNECTSIL